MTNPEINEAVGLLALKNPEALEQLKKEFTNHADLLKPGKTLGGEQPSAPDPAEILVRAKVSLAGLVLVLNICESSLPALKKRLKNLGNLQLVSQVIVGLSGATLLTQNQASFPQLKVIIGVLALIGSLLSLYAQRKSGTILNNSESIFSYYDRLVDDKFEAESLRREIEIELQLFNVNRPMELIAKKIDESNKICMDIRKMLDKI